MADTASVDDLIAVLELGTSSGDTDLADQLRSKFGISPGTDLATGLRTTPPGEVLAALVSAVAPVAEMVRDLYSWLGQLRAVRSAGNLSVQVTDAQMRTMSLDLARYAAYERTVVEDVSTTQFVPDFLPPDSPLMHFHDLHHPPACLTNPGTAAPLCRNCRPGLSGDFRRLEMLLERAASATTAEDGSIEHFDPQRKYFFESLRRLLPRVLMRRHRGDCRYEHPYVADYLRSGLPDLEGCFRETAVENLRTFFELPYWKSRWQVFELWVLRLVLESYGTDRWHPALTDGVWNLRAGSTNPAAVATSQLTSGRELRCYYQHDSVPPAPIFAGLRDRPELLVTVADAMAPADPGAEAEPVLLAVEAKARAGYGPQELKSAVLPLLEWQPSRILGVSFFSASGADQLHVQSFAETPVGVAEAVVPGSASTAETTAWLKGMWRSVPRPQVTIIAADRSGSMSPNSARRRLKAMTESANSRPRPQWAGTIVENDLLYLSTFGGKSSGLRLLSEFSAREITKTTLTPLRTAQHLDRAIMAWRAELPPLHLVRLDLHLITDGQWVDADLAAIEAIRDSGATVHVHLTDDPARLRLRRELLPYVVATEN